MKNSAPIHPSLIKKSESVYSLIFMAVTGIALAILMASCTQHICPSYGNIKQQKTFSHNYSKRYAKKYTKKFKNNFALQNK